MNKEQLLSRLDQAWKAFQDSYSGISDSDLMKPGVSGKWSIKDVIAHVSVWEGEALKYLPVMKGESTPRYSVMYGGIDAFNALMVDQKRNLTAAETIEEAKNIHTKLIQYIKNSDEQQFRSETRFRRRLRFDTYSHYPKHTKAIWEWRQKQGI